MRYEPFSFTSQDDVSIFCHRWIPDDQVKIRGIVQIVHGLAEHGMRYEHVAQALTTKGYVVYADDHRGHGRSALMLGHIGFGGWAAILEDIQFIGKRASEEYPGVPLFLLGHSMGSFLAQEYMQHLNGEERRIEGCVLSGTNGHMDTVSRVAGKMILGQELKKAPDRPNERLQEIMIYKQLNGEWRKTVDATGFEWISSDPREVERYDNDPFCGHLCTAQTWSELFDALGRIWKKENEQLIPKELPVYLFSGDQDPVSKKTKGVRRLIKRYEAQGMTDIAYRFYTGRHEMFNERLKEQVIADLISWLEIKTTSR